MKTRHLAIIIMCILVEISSAGIANAMIQPPFLTLQTDKDGYQSGGMVVISGLVADDLAKENPTIFVRIFGPDGSLYYKRIIPLEKVDNPTTNMYAYGFKYSCKFQLNGTNPGDYEIIASNYSEKYLTKWGVKIITYDGGYPNRENYRIFQMPTVGSNDTNPIKYGVSKGISLLVMSYANWSGTITSLVHTDGGGQFSVEIPRKLADSKYDNGTDRSFGVGMGSFDVALFATGNFKEIENNANYRTLQITLPQSNSTERIMISGWKAIPEFPFAIPILLIGIVSVIVFYRVKFGK